MAACYRRLVGGFHRLIGLVYGLRLLRQRPVQVAALAVVAALVLAFRALQFALLTREVQWGYDFSFYWTAGRRLLNGEAIYSAAQLAGPYAPQGQDGFLYPPPFAALVAPLAALFPNDFRAAAWVWTALGAAVLVLAVLALWRSERLGDRFPIMARRGRWFLVAAAFAFPPVVGELVLGNVHLLLLGLLTLAWLGIRRDDRQGEWIAGLAVGAAAIIKVFPGVLIVWFLLTRRYRAAAGVVVGAAALTLVTLPVTGIEPWLQYPTVLANLSAPADTTDTLAPTVWLAPVLGFTVARIVVTVVGLAILAWAALRAGPQPSPDATRPDYAAIGMESAARRETTARSFAIAVTISVLIAPALYHHYLAVLVLPLVLGLATGVPLVLVAASYLLMWGGEQAAFGDLTWIVNRALPTAGALLLLLALIARPRGGRGARAAGDP
jgi:glycosyl transferase family 87